MEPYVHTLNRNEHLIFLNEKRIDPVTGERITDGDRIVICSRCKTAHLLHSWNDNGQKCPIKDCKSESTLNYVPQENYTIQFEKNNKHKVTTTRKKRKDEGTSKYYRKPANAVPATKDRRFRSKVLYFIISTILLAIVILIFKPQIFNLNKYFEQDQSEVTRPNDQVDQNVSQRQITILNEDENSDYQRESKEVNRGEISLIPPIEKESSTNVRKQNDDIVPNFPENTIPRLGRSNLVENELSRITDTKILLEKLSHYQNTELLISYGTRSEIGNVEGCYIFIVDNNKVNAVFRYKENVYYDVKSTEQLSDLSDRFSGKKAIWVKDYSKFLSKDKNEN